MATYKLFQVDAFTDRLFAGNPAAVCILDRWIDDKLMQSVANENNLAETAFLVADGKDFEIRWFTPAVEVDLCGHATLASAFVLFNILGYAEPVIRFYSPRSGLLTVTRDDDMFFLDFPTDRLEPAGEEQVIAIEKAIGVKPLEVYRGKTDYIAVIPGERLLLDLKPDLDKVSRLEARGLVVTSAGDKVDFVSRFFAPQSGINEDPVTGSAHTSLTPLWSKKTGKTKLVARQLSKRGGQLLCEYMNERCLIGGKAMLYLTGEIILD